MPVSSRSAFIGAAAGVGLLIGVWFLAFHLRVFENADQSIFRGFYQLHQRGHIYSIASFIAPLCDPNPYVYFAAVPVLVAIARRRPWLALAVVAILLGANVTTQLLKPLLAEPRAASQFGGVSPVGAASWPSGHATAAMSLALCSVLAAPPRLRPLVAALGAGFAVAVSYSFLTLGWHYPSDVLGGFLVAATWTLLGIGTLLSADVRTARAASPEDRPVVSIPEALAPPALVLVAAGALACVVLIVRPHEVVSYARAHEAFTIGASAIGVLGLALATGIALALRR